MLWPLPFLLTLSPFHTDAFVCDRRAKSITRRSITAESITRRSITKIITRKSQFARKNSRSRQEEGFLFLLDTFHTFLSTKKRSTASTASMASMPATILDTSMGTSGTRQLSFSRLSRIVVSTRRYRWRRPSTELTISRVPWMKQRSSPLRPSGTLKCVMNTT